MRTRVSAVAAAVVVVITIGGCGLLGGNKTESLPYAPAATDAPASEAPTPEATETTPPAPKPSSKKPKPKKTSVAPTADPNNFQLPACAKRSGKKVSKAQAKAALTAAAGKTYWPATEPKLKVSGDLVKSVAWHESGWQADIVNCDGGRGLMQVMPDTVTMINNRFGQSYVATDYKQNAIIGANYLAWLTRYFGKAYFKDNFDLSPAKCKTHASMCLLNMVISAYNSGFGSVDDGYASKQLPNLAYVDSVRSLMTSCYCDRF
jgi:soluble lytic murein transglycosylase-like protein